MRASDRNLTILTEPERQALYGLPDFDVFQRAEYFALTTQELSLAHRRNSVPDQLLCMLQLGYFKAKQTFFGFTFADVPKEDIEFLLRHYFPGKSFNPKPIRKAEYYAQRKEIARLFGYRPWPNDYMPLLAEKAAMLVTRDVTPGFVAAELIAFLRHEKIIRPRYTTVRAVISEALSAERRRLGEMVDSVLDEKSAAALRQLLVRDDTLSELAAIKQDAKNFGYNMMRLERQKRALLEPLYQIAKRLLPQLNISQQNVAYYASLVYYYTIYDLRRLQPSQTNLYLLCYAWHRYRQLNDNLVDAMGYHMKKIEAETRSRAEKQFFLAQIERQPDGAKVGRLLLLYVEDEVTDDTLFGEVRNQAFEIMPKEDLLITGRRFCEKPVSQMEFRWQALDKAAGRIRKQLRPLAMTLDFSSTTADSPYLAALRWMKGVFSRHQQLSQRPISEIPAHTIPKQLHPHLLEFDSEGNAIRLRSGRYEFWIYRQVRKRLEAGNLYVDDSVGHRLFSDELVPPDREASAIQALDIPWLRQPVDTTLDNLFAELNGLWQTFERELRQGKLKHLEFDKVRKKLTWHRPKADKDKTLQDSFYSKVQSRDITDVFRFVNEQCSFLSAMTPLQPRYAKKIADEDSLMAVIIAQAMNHGNLSMAETCDIPYHILDETHHQYLRLATLKAANDRISNFISQLPIFPYYSLDLEVLYGSVDGQKFETGDPTVKSRYSRKYFGAGKGVVAFSLLANQIPLQTELLSANQHESYWVFDICYNNTADIVPTLITGDMHSINKANFAILYWFGMALAPRFTNLDAQLKHLFCGNNPEEYRDYLIQPLGQIDRQLIVDEKTNIDRIVATLGLKEMSQATLVRKLCTLSTHHRTRMAVFEFDKLIRSIYTLRYLLDSQLQRNVHRSQNRIESYHQLRSAIAQVAGKKELTGQTELDVAISNQCGRLIANVAIAYNSILLSTLLTRYQTDGNQKALALFKKISPVAWQHIHLLGRYNFRDKHPIDLKTLLGNVNLR